MTGVVGVTGHRVLEHPIYVVKARLRKLFSNKLKPSLVITGMAIGFDQVVADFCMENNIPFLAAVPFVGQESLWLDPVKASYRNLLDHATEVVVVNTGEYEPWKLMARNQWIVDRSDALVEYLLHEHGGTWDCHNRIVTTGKPVYNIGHSLAGVL